MCIFCKIIAGEIPNYTVYEDKNILAFLDIAPHTKGHTVVVPKKHYERLSDMDLEVWQGIAVGLKKVQEKLDMVLKPVGFNIGVNDGKVAGQVVPHVHWHVFPRYEKDGGGSIHSIINNPGEESLEDLYKKF